jgi:hypothetical protein
MNPVASRIHKALEENELGVVRELPNELLLRSLPNLRVCSAPDSVLFVSGRRAQSLKPSWTALQSKAGFDGDEKREYAEVKLTRALFNTRTFRLADSEHCFISFEAPLLRQDSRCHGIDTPKCDLIALSTGVGRRSIILTAVEVKCKGFSDKSGATSIPFGLLEGWVYGALLDAHRGDKNEQGRLKEGVRACYQRKGEPLGFLDWEHLKMEVRFALLLTESELGGERLTIADAARRVGDIVRKIEADYCGPTAVPLFSGYWVLLGGAVKYRGFEPGHGKFGEVRFDIAGQVALIKYDRLDLAKRSI